MTSAMQRECRSCTLSRGSPGVLLCVFFGGPGRSEWRGLQSSTATVSHGGPPPGWAVTHGRLFQRHQQDSSWPAKKDTEKSGYEQVSLRVLHASLHFDRSNVIKSFFAAKSTVLASFLVLFVSHPFHAAFSAS